MSEESEKKYWSKGYRNKRRGGVGDGGIGCFMFLAYIGAAVYFVSQAHGFWEGVLGLLKAAVWPAFLVYQVLHGYHV
jgi:hypothetical protein